MPDRVDPSSGPASTAPALKEASKRLRCLAALDPNWDSYGADPPSPRAIEAARDIIGEVATWFGDVPNFADALDLAPTPDGGVLLMRDGASRETQIRVNRDRQLDALLIDEEAGERRYH